MLQSAIVRILKVFSMAPPRVLESVAILDCAWMWLEMYKYLEVATKIIENSCLLIAATLINTGLHPLYCIYMDMKLFLIICINAIIIMFLFCWHY